ncbi:hydroxyacylglutathione hydrolase [Pseudomonas sp. KNUC1026]|uniref:hydroxyacylglutathione hydrolase n=1 Tax=Pseudomonas sp. KNUC1026 TaxID=2893890 RepID=UPI001F433C8D|nr:hydroxyacylglutathione hydrolase [Pseudomonas sp. KNUC1026]UFH51654.1 hydroxyacylglutathione hydrolase [Pseudomonas sp. KNUC1026]
MIQIQPLRAFNDNYIWLLQDTATYQCAVVDPGDAAPVQAWLEANPGWVLADILITHHHHDHVGGVLALKTLTGARVTGPADETIPGRDVAVAQGSRASALGLDFEVLHVPGHTLGHIMYYCAGHEAPLLFSGDTLFAAGCGRLFEGTPAMMHQSLSKTAAMPDGTLVYCAHEYTLSNLRFAAAVEPGNAAITERLEHVAALRERDGCSLPSTLALERSTNPFLRIAETSVKQKADERNGTPCTSTTEVFRVLRAWKDQF